MGIDPISWAAIGAFMSTWGTTIAGGAAAAAGIAGTAVTAVGQSQAAKSQEQASEYNAKIMERQALDAERRGSMAEAEHRTQSNRIIGAMHAEEGASGVVAGSGSGEDVFAEAAEYGARNAAVARLSGGREAFGARSQATLDRYQGSVARSQGMGRVAGTALTGASQMFNTDAPWWHSLKRKPGDDLALAPEDYRWG